jgi:hypothetical protein
MQVDFHKVCASAQQQPPFAQVVVAVRSGLVRWAQQFDHRDQPAAEAIADLQKSLPFLLDSHCRQKEFHRGRDRTRGGGRCRFRTWNSQTDIGTTDVAPLLGRQFVQVETHFHFDDIAGTNLAMEYLPRM